MVMQFASPVFAQSPAPERWQYIGPASNPALVAIAPSSPSTVYAVGGNGTIQRSRDRGATWRVMNTDSLFRGLYGFLVHPRNPDLLYMGTVEQSFGSAPVGLFRSQDGGKSWDRLGGDRFKDVSVQTLAIDPTFPEVIYAGVGDYASAQSIWRSVDSGDHWDVTGRSADSFEIVAIDPIQSNNIYVPDRPGTNEEGVMVKSTDRGLHWSRIGTIATGLFVDLDPTDPPDFGDPDDVEQPSVYTIVVDPTHSGTLYTTTSGPIFKSVDGGAHWFPVGVNAPWSEVPCPRSLLAHPSLSGHLACAGYRSVNGGLDWTLVSPNSPERMVYDPVNPDTLYALGGGVLRSEDGGINWATMGAVGWVLTQLSFQPSSPSVMLAATDGGLYRTANGGTSWTLLHAGEKPAGVLFLERSPSDERVIYLAQSDYPSNPSIPAAYYRSDDSGISWISIQSNLPYGFPEFLTVDPVNASRVYLGAGRKLFVTVNGGTSWETIPGAPSNGYLTSLLIDPSHPAVLYANTPGGPYRSPNRGKNWSPIQTGLPPFSGTILSIDRDDSTVLYALEGLDLYRTVDSGQHWSLWHTGSQEKFFRFLRVDPHDSSVFYAVAADYQPLDGLQLLRSPDKGKTWFDFGPLSPPSRGAFELAVDPARPGVFYVGTTYYGGLMVASPNPVVGPVPSLSALGLLVVGIGAGIAPQRRLRRARACPP